MNKIKTYDGHFVFSKTSVEKNRDIQSIFDKHDLLADIDLEAVEFEFAGRDFGDRIVYAFQEFARVIDSADGELRCEIVDDDDDEIDPRYIFFTIQDGLLWEQTGTIIRGPRKACE